MHKLRHRRYVFHSWLSLEQLLIVIFWTVLISPKPTICFFQPHLDSPGLCSCSWVAVCMPYVMINTHFELNEKDMICFLFFVLICILCCRKSIKNKSFPSILCITDFSLIQLDVWLHKRKKHLEYRRNHRKMYECILVQHAQIYICSNIPMEMGWRTVLEKENLPVES